MLTQIVLLLFFFLEKKIGDTFPFEPDGRWPQLRVPGKKKVGRVKVFIYLLAKNTANK
jgi:hypothetical protein